MSASQSGLFAAEYSAVNQRLVMQQEHGRAEYFGQLRFDSILAGRIVVPDSHLFDGRFFLELGPDDVRRWVAPDPGQQLPLVFKTRRGALSETLAVWLERPGSETLNGFPFNVIRSDAVRAELAAALRETPVNDLRRRLRRDKNVAVAIGGLLRDLIDARGMLLEAEADIALLERGWSLWLEAERDGRAGFVQTWNKPFELRAAMNLDPVDLDRDLATRTGRELMTRVWNLDFRSDANALFRAAAADAGTPGELLEIETVSSWYTDSRHRAFAIQHECDFAHPERLDRPPVGLVRRALLRAAQGADGATPATLPVPPNLLDDLAAIPADQFREVLTRTRDQASAWRQTGDADDLARLIEALDRSLSRSKPVPAERPALAQLFAKAPAAAVGFAAAHAGASPTFAILAALISDVLLASRERLRAATAKAARSRIVEYGLARTRS